MVAQPDEIQLVALTKLDQLELQSLDNLELQAKRRSVFRFKKSTDGGDQHGELALATAIVLVTYPALLALAVWASKNRKTLTIKRTKQVHLPDGSQEAETVEVSFQSSMSDPEALKHLASALKIDPASLVE